MPEIMELASKLGLPIDEAEAIYYLGRVSLFTTGDSKMMVLAQSTLCLYVQKRRIPGGLFRVTCKPRCGTWRSDPALALGPRVNNSFRVIFQIAPSGSMEAVLSIETSASCAKAASLANRAIPLEIVPMLVIWSRNLSAGRLALVSFFW